MAFVVMLFTSLALLGFGTHASSLHLMQICRGQACPDRKFPILDYVAEEYRCVCRAHPCWDDNGLEHDCSLESGLHLSFMYTEDKSLQCGCSDAPHQSSLHISKDLCPGHNCVGSFDYPLLDWDSVEQKCLCRKNPCLEIEGAVSKCADPKFPILSYREDLDPMTGGAKPVCECMARFSKPSSSLRGGSGMSEIVILATGEGCAKPRQGRRSSSAW